MFRTTEPSSQCAPSHPESEVPTGPPPRQPTASSGQACLSDTTLSCGPAVSWFSGRESCGSVVTLPYILVQTHRRIRGTPRIFLFDHSAPSGDVKNSQRGSPPFRGCFLNIYGKMFGLHEPALSSVKQPVGRAGTIPEHFSRSFFFTQAPGGLLPFLVTAFRALLAPKSCWRLSAVHI